MLGKSGGARHPHDAKGFHRVEEGTGVLDSPHRDLFT